MGLRHHLCSLTFVAACLAGSTATAAATDLPYKETSAFLGLDAEFLGVGQARTPAATTDQIGHLALSMRVQSAGRRTFELEMQLGIHSFSLESLGLETLYAYELLLGGRIFPLTPPLALGQIAIRPTLSVLAGGYLGDGTQGLIASFTAGVAFSFGEDTTGLTVEGVYRPIGYSLSSTTPVRATPSFSLRLGFFFGP